MGWHLYSDALGWSDSLVVFNARPVFSLFPSPHDPILSNPSAYISEWYRHVNGRLTVAVTDSLIALFSRVCCPTPESFPWWLFRSLSLFAILAAPMNMVAAGVWHYGRRSVSILLVALLWVFWSINPSIYGYTVWMDCLLIDRYVPLYILSMAMLAMVRGWPKPGFWAWLLHGLVFLSLAVNEQFMFVVPVLFLGFAWLGASACPSPCVGRIMFVARRTLIYAGLTAIAVAVYFASPGQRSRTESVPVNRWNEVSLVTWYQQAVAVASKILCEDNPGPPKDVSPWLVSVKKINIPYGKTTLSAIVLHSILILAVVMATLALYIRLHCQKNALGPEFCERAAGLGILALAFFLAHIASSLTLLVSPHFPPYVRNLPTFLLAMGWIYSVAQFYEIIVGLLSGSAMVNRRRVGVRLTGILLFATSLAVVLWWRGAPALESCRASYQAACQNDRMRRRLFDAVVAEWQATGQTAFRILNVPPSAEAAWAIAAYFRWRNIPVQAFIEGQTIPPDAIQNIAWTNFVWRASVSDQQTVNDAGD